MPIAIIDDFIRNKAPYATGLELLAKHSPNNFLISLGPGVASSFFYDKLISELQKISDSVPAVKPPPPSSLKKLPPVQELMSDSESKYIRIDYANLTSNLKERNRLKSALYQQARIAHENLDKYEDIDTRRDAALLIIKNFEQIDEIWSELEYFQINGEEKNPDRSKALSEHNALELSNMRNNLNKRIYKTKDETKRNELLQELKNIEKILENAYFIK